MDSRGTSEPIFLFHLFLFSSFFPPTVLRSAEHALKSPFPSSPLRRENHRFSTTSRQIDWIRPSSSLLLFLSCQILLQSTSLHSPLICANFAHFLFSFFQQEKPHKCELCQKSFPTPGDLKSHMYIHNGSWPHRCPICDRGFSKVTNLKNHLFLHTGEKREIMPFFSSHVRNSCQIAPLTWPPRRLILAGPRRFFLHLPLFASPVRPLPTNSPLTRHFSPKRRDR